jgi:antirestriction protein ArdC
MSGSKLESKICEVGDRLLSLLESGIEPWGKDWVLRQGGSFVNAATGRAYRGQNTVFLMIDVILRGYQSRFYLGFAQAQDLGLKMIKGSKSCMVLFPRFVKVTNEETGEDERALVGWSWSNVFNLDCFENGAVKDKILAKFDKHQDQKPLTTPHEFVKELLDYHQPKLIYDDSQNPYYSVFGDYISMPSLGCFKTAEGYAATLLHEMAHWTGHKERLNRVLVGFKQDMLAYAYEELVAEMCAAILTTEAGIPYALEFHASYIQSWISLLKDDPKVFARALKDAGRASMFLYPHNYDQD